eukprot:TRINITY_DN60287_c0_g1_i1.p1 TRINITY_DN60287_c0_g1~~TRINITY_DN60287_c0_g1_i1.p1  ORF type:complete len:622 (+),score=256.60 TRINITY_DN60287_c0_g1_i1:73-1866(+)
MARAARPRRRVALAAAAALLLAPPGGVGQPELGAADNGAAEKAVAVGPAVATLNGDNFEQVLGEYDAVLVNFYAPWCSFCRRVEPAFEKAAERLRTQDVVCGRVDATAESELADKENIAAYPTIKVYVRAPGAEGHSEYEYDGGLWSAEDIISWALSNVGPAIRELGDGAVHEIVKVLSSGGTCVVAVLPEGPEGESLTVLEKLASKWRGSITFATVPDPAWLGTRWGPAVEVGQVAVFAAWHDGPLVYRGPLETPALQDFIEANRARALDEITPANHKFYTTRGLPLAYLFVSKADERRRADALEVFEQVGETFRGKVSCVYLDGEKYRALAQKMGLTGTTFPCVALQDAEGVQSFPFPEHERVERNSVAQFIRRFFAGQLQATLRSEAPPARPVDTDGVTILVGSTFMSQAMSGAKDVLVLFHAPWCTQCARVAPVYGHFARLTKDVRTLLVAKIDGGANDVPEGLFGSEKYPRIYFIPARPRSAPILYEGAHTVSALLLFVQSHAAQRVNVTYVPDAPEVDVRADPLLHGEETDAMDYALKGEHRQLAERVRLLEGIVQELQQQVRELQRRTERRRSPTGGPRRPGTGAAADEL